MTDWAKLCDPKYWPLAEIVRTADWSAGNALAIVAQKTQELGFMTDINEALFDFINSKDIKGHLKSLNYQFDSCEAAWLIFQNRERSVTERICAWCCVYAFLPDSRCESGGWSDRWDYLRSPDLTIHQLLREGIPEVVKALDEFFTSDAGHVYKFSMVSAHWGPRHVRTYEGIARNVERCITKIREDLYNEERPFRVSLEKVSLESDDRAVEAAFWNDVLIDPFCACHEESAGKDLNLALLGMWFAFPTPFEVGDVIYDPIRYMSEPCSFKGTVVVSQPINEWAEKRGRPGIDDSDMTYCGYFLEDNGSFYHEVQHNYMDMELFPEEEYKGVLRALKTLGSFLKGKIDVGLFANAYLQIIFDHLREEHSFSLEWHGKEACHLAGILEEKSGE